MSFILLLVRRKRRHLDLENDPPHDPPAGLDVDGADLVEHEDVEVRLPEPDDVPEVPDHDNILVHLHAQEDRY